MRKTKIVCTMGPSTDKPGILRQLMENGMNVARFNFSHGDYEEHKGRYDKVRALSKELDLPIACMLDTKGPEIRLGEFKNGVEKLTTGQKFTLTSRSVEGTNEICSVTYKELPHDVKPGGRIMLDDGLIELRIDEVGDTDIVCTVCNDGIIKTKKGVNVPGVHLSMPYMSQRDTSDILFGVEQGFDLISASFARNAQDIMDIRHILDEHNSKIRIIAKIENAEGLENLDEIIEASDGIMVARGDLGVEIAPEKLPHLQKMMIKKCSAACKVVITATQMLDSMIRNPRPTRAEVSDVANAVYDGTDVVMLSGETANGKYPVEALKMMAHIVEETESHMNGDFYEKRTVSDDNRHNISNAVSYASVATAESLDAAVIIAPSISGYTARMLSKWHPSTKLVGMSPSISAVRKMMLYWGVTPFQAKRAESTDTLIENSIDILKENGIVKTGDIAVVTAGVVDYARRHEPAASTNIMRVVNID